MLSEFRQRLIHGQKEQVIFDALLDYLRTQGVLKARGRQRTDSTHVLGAIRQLNRLEFVIETVRHALNTLAVVAPDWIQSHVSAEWVLGYDQRAHDYHLPSSDQQRTRLAETVGQGGQQILTWIDDVAADQWLGNIPAIRTLRQVWEEQYTSPPDALRWLNKQGMPAPTQQVSSPYNPEARWANKGSRTWVGYKVFLTKTCDLDQPRLITHVATTPASTADETQVDPIHADLAQADLLPTEHLMDAGFVHVEHVLNSLSRYGVKVVGPVARDSSWQAHTPHAFEKRQFHVDWERQVVTCPMGKESHLWLTDQQGIARQVQVFFNRDDCLVCSARDQCTRSKKGARILSLQPRPKHEALQDLRQQQQTDMLHARGSSVSFPKANGVVICNTRAIAGYQRHGCSNSSRQQPSTCSATMRGSKANRWRPHVTLDLPLSWLPDFTNSVMKTLGAA